MFKRKRIRETMKKKNVSFPSEGRVRVEKVKGDRYLWWMDSLNTVKGGRAVRT
jgi:hypothetical protein